MSDGSLAAGLAPARGAGWKPGRPPRISMRGSAAEALRLATLPQWPAVLNGAATNNG